MPAGFFSESQLLQIRKPMSMVAKCGACGFYTTCQSPKQEPQGKGRRKILIIGAWPTMEADQEGKMMQSNYEATLSSSLRKHGLDLYKDCWVTNALICSPSQQPDNSHLDYCRPNLIRTIKKLNPVAIITLGTEANNSLIGWLWKSDVGSIMRWSGFTIPSQRLNTWICPTFHPQYVLVQKDKKNPIPNVLMDRHIGRAVELAEEGRPFDPDNIPDYRKEVEIVLDVKDAANIIRKMIRKGGPASFDYECTMLKPEGAGAQIISCAICWRGKKTIAYPWYRESIEATKEFFASDMPKIAANMKFEDRWTRKILGTEVNNWAFDTMIGAHAIDSRGDTKSLKFQSFVHLGMESYNDHLERMLQSGGSMMPNRIKEIDLEDLLLYNGLDALLEYKIAEVQTKILGIEWFS